MFLDREDATSLMQINWHWEKWYSVSVIDGMWTATPRAEPDDPDAVLRAEDAWSLRMLLRTDSAERARRSRDAR